MTSALISAAELKKIMDAPDVKILDASYGLPPAQGVIGRAIDFDIDVVADLNAPQPHTLPPADHFAHLVGEMGIGNDDRVIVYDRAGMAMAAARAWWMFRVFGHDKVQILDGGLPAWMKAGYSLAPHAEAIHPPKTFQPKFRPELFRQKQDMLDNLAEKSFTVIDARDPKRYSGAAPEPRPGVQSGHIPGALNVPYASLIDPATGLFKGREELKSAIAPIPPKTPVAVSCGSGVTACVVALAFYELGNDNAAIYGGSWAEWGSDPSLPKKTGNSP